MGSKKCGRNFVLNSYVVLIGVKFRFQKGTRVQPKSEEKWTETLCGHYFLHLIWWWPVANRPPPGGTKYFDYTDLGEGDNLSPLPIKLTLHHALTQGGDNYFTLG